MRDNSSRSPTAVPPSRRVKNLDLSSHSPDTEPMAAVCLTDEAAEQLERLPKPIHARVLHLLERLRNWPDVSGAKPLRGELAGSYRLRTGDYRLRFRPKGEKVMVDKIGHRDDFYED